MKRYFIVDTNGDGWPIKVPRHPTKSTAYTYQMSNDKKSGLIIWGRPDDANFDEVKDKEITKEQAKTWISRKTKQALS